MKSLKAAAVVAGSLVIAGAAAPAFANDTADLTPAGLNGVVDTPAPDSFDMTPLRYQSNVLDTENKSSPLSKVKDATTKLNTPGSLLGGLPLRG
ncbi:hypothetical protein [Streptomyces sp. NPDC003401]